MNVRVRYAPSPTGYLHIGNARTALFNFLFARAHKGTMVVRIEDTDVKRNVEKGVENQMENLRWLGIDWDESIDKGGPYGPYRQLERLDIYQKFAEELIEQGLAYKCYCSPEELEAEREEKKKRGDSNLHYSRKCLGKPDQDGPYMIRFKVPDETTYTFNDIVKGDVTFKSEDVGDWVIIKRNGIPTYNFACAVDDHLMAISHVLRGEDHITNTPKQLMVYDAFNWRRPLFGHMPLIVNEEQKKLSKRDGNILQFIEQYKDRGFLPEALFNFIALLGWSPDKKEEILTRDELIKRFDENRMSNSPATFDKDKLHFINNRYIKALSDEALMDLCKPFLLEAGIGEGKEDAWFENLVSLFKDRLSFGQEIVDVYRDFFERPFNIEGEALDFLKQDGVKALLEAFKSKLESSQEFDANTIKKAIKESGKETGMKGKMLFMPIRIAVSGAMHGPDLPKMMELMGKSRLVDRLDYAIGLL
ncbi:MAG: glutamate--tRNA ligase [Bacillota bacterium]